MRLPDFVIALAREKRVLDIGSIGHDFEERLRLGTFYLKDLAAASEYVKGIDILDEHVQRARAQGYNVACANAEEFTDEQPYDVIFAGELIEHLSNPGNFLRCCRSNLKTGGLLIITTPNAYSLSRVAKSVIKLTNEPPLNPEHTCYYTPATLSQLVSREGLVMNRICYADYDYGSLRVSRAKRIMLEVNRAVTERVPHMSQSIVAIISK